MRNATLCQVPRALEMEERVQWGLKAVPSSSFLVFGSCKVFHLEKGSQL